MPLRHSLIRVHLNDLIAIQKNLSPNTITLVMRFQHLNWEAGAKTLTSWSIDKADSLWRKPAHWPFAEVKPVWANPVQDSVEVHRPPYWKRHGDSQVCNRGGKCRLIRWRCESLGSVRCPYGHTLRWGMGRLTHRRYRSTTALWPTLGDRD